MTAIVESVPVVGKRPYSNPDYEPRTMKLRCGWDSALEAEAQERAGQVRLTSEENCGGNQPWTPVTDERPAPGGHKFRTTEGVIYRHISESQIHPSPVPWLPKGLLPAPDWSLLEKVDVEYHVGDARPQWSARNWVASVMPEPDRLPDNTPINGMAFDEKPWLDTMPLAEFAAVGYANRDNDLKARGNPLPGTTWDAHDRAHRKAGPQRLATSDGSCPPDPSLIAELDRWYRLSPEDRRRERKSGCRYEPTPPKDSLDSLRGRQCRGCLGRIAETEHGRVRYCSEQCRNRSENFRRKGKVGTVRPGVELATFVVTGQRIGIDTVDRGFSRLLGGAA